MATGKASRPAPSRSAAARSFGGFIRRHWRWILGAILLIAALLLAWQLPMLKKKAELGTAFGARIACSCRYIEGRDIKSCETDFEPGMELVTLTDDPAARRVTASVPLLASRTVGFDDARGCQFVAD